MAILVSSASERQFFSCQKILRSLQLNKVGSLVAIWTAQKNVRTLFSVQEDSEQLSISVCNRQDNRAILLGHYSVFEKILNNLADMVCEDSLQPSRRGD
jgi:hypothetical protein